MKKILCTIITSLLALNMVGCSFIKSSDEKEEKEIVTSNDTIKEVSLDAKKIVKDKFGEDDPHFDFKVNKTTEFLNKAEKIKKYFDVNIYSNVNEPEQFDSYESQSQLRYLRAIESTSETELVDGITEADFGIYFNDGESDQNTFQEYDITIRDVDEDGKVKIEGKAKEIFDIIGEVDTDEINESIKKAIKLQNEGKTGKVTTDPESRVWVGVYVLELDGEPMKVEIKVSIQDNYQ